MNELACIIPAAMEVPACVSRADFKEFLMLPEDERAYVIRNIRLFAHIDESEGPLMRRCAHAALLARRDGLGRGWSKDGIYRRYRLFTDGGRKLDAQGNPDGPVFEPGDWRTLLRQYSCGKDGLPTEFVAYLVQLWSQTTREKDSFRGVCLRLYRAWLADEEIPGYGHASAWYTERNRMMPYGNILRKQDLPDGWSECNLSRALKKALPRKSSRRAAQGQANRVAVRWGEQLLRDRSQLKPLQLWTIDDVRLDVQARMFVDGKWQIVYVDALFALDVASGYVLAYGLKGMATRGDDTEAGRAAGTKMSIDSRDVRHLLTDVLKRFGLPPYKSTLLCEMATAKLSKDDEIAWTHLLGSQLEIEYTGMGRGQLLKSGFGEEFGRPQMKGYIEAFFRKVHTTLNHLPGTTGRRYELSRGDLPERIRYTQRLLKQAEARIGEPLRPDHPIMAQLQVPLMSVEEINGVVGEIVHELNWRTGHNLQGFDMVTEYVDERGVWLKEEELYQLAPDARQQVQLHRRMEAPAERMQRLCRAIAAPFEKLDPIVLAALYTEKRACTLRAGIVAIQDQRISSDRLVFACKDNSLDGYDGQDGALLAYVSPDYSHIVVADRSSGAHLSTLWREQRVSLADTDAIGKRAGEVHRAQESELAHIRSYLGEEETAFARMREQNDAVLSDDNPRMRLGDRSAIAREIASARELSAQASKSRSGIRRSTTAAARQIEESDLSFADIARADEEVPEEADYTFDDITGILSGDSQ